MTKTRREFEPEIVSSPEAANIKVAANENCGLSTKQAAHFLGVSPKTLINWRWQKKGPPYAKGESDRGFVRYPLKMLATWRDAQVRNPINGER